MNNDEIKILRKKFFEDYKEGDFYSATENLEKLIKLYGNNYDEYEQSIDLYNLGLLYQKIGKVSMSLKLYKKIIKILDNKDYDISNEKDIKKLKMIIDTENAIGICYSKMDSMGSRLAIESLEKALKLCKRYFIDDKEKIANIMHNLGCIFYDMERYEDAIYHHLEELSLRTNFDLSYIDNLNFLGYDYEAAGNYEKAVGFFIDALDRIKGLQGIKSDEYMNNTYYLANVFYKMKDYEKSCKYYEKSCKYISEKLGESHPYFADALTKLSESLVKTGKRKEALNVQLKAAKIVQDTVGENHIFYASNIKKLGDIYYLEGEYDRALSYYEKETKIKKDIIGIQNEECVNSILNLINVKIKAKKQDKLEEYENEILNLINLNFTEKSYKRALLILAKIYVENQNIDGLYKVYDYFKQVDSTISFDDMLKLSNDIEENILNKENNNFKEDEEITSEEDIFDGLKNFLDNFKEQVERFSNDDEKNEED